MTRKKCSEIPVWRKYALTLEEAALYYGIGINKLRALTDEHDKFVIMNGTKRLIKRKQFAKFLDEQRVI